MHEVEPDNHVRVEARNHPIAITQRDQSMEEQKDPPREGVGESDVAAVHVFRKPVLDDITVTIRSLVAAINATVLPAAGQENAFRLELRPHMEGFCQLALTFRGEVLYPDTVFH